MRIDNNFKVAIYCRLGNDPDKEKVKEDKTKIQLNERIKKLYEQHHKEYFKVPSLKIYDKHKSCL